jgi:hypothetical protein
MDKIVKQSVSEAMKSVNSKLENIESKLKNKIQFVSEKMESFQLEVITKMEKAEMRTDKIQLKQEELQKKITQLDRTAKGSNLVFFGIHVKALQDKTVHENLVQSIMEILVEADIQGISEEDIGSVTRITPAGKPQLLLVRMKTLKAKQKLYSQRTKLRQCKTRVYVNEDLTKEESLIHKKARKQVKDGTLHSCWTLDGLVYGKSSPEGKPFQIKEL